MRTKDELFLAFASAFGLLALNAALPTVLNIPLEERSWVYLLRLAALSLLIVAILRKNMRGGNPDAIADSCGDPIVERQQLPMPGAEFTA